MQLFNQCDPRWGPHALGTVHPGTICAYGCDLNVLAMIANASGHPTTPPALDALFDAKHIYTRDPTGTYDFLPNNALDLAFPGDYLTTHYAGWRPDIIRAAIPTPDAYIELWLSGVYSPLWRMVIPTHFVMGWSADGGYIADPEGGVVRALSAYGGPAAVKAVNLIKRLPAKPVAVATPPAPATAPAMASTAPAPVPVPPPLYSVATATGIVLAGGLDYAAAVARAAAAAKARPGSLWAVLDAKGATVETEFVALEPGPVEAPPTKPLPTPPPPIKQDGWAVLQQVIIALVLAFRPTK